ncbi:MAG: alpha/beta fold hydrolase [Deltaproteobacteria bacterium]|nr:alpha/beta fold hydrolase [Deltaproteobacteria bacterium]
MASSKSDDVDSTLEPFVRELARAPDLELAKPQRLAPGARVDRYVVVEHIGDGGMGSVYRARDSRLDRFVALKRLKGALDSERVARFLREARALAAISHPNVVAIHDVGSDQDGPFLALELLDGETLRDRVGRGPLPAEEVVRVGLGVLAALGAVHQRGVVHRDLKPENLFATRDGQIKLLDFGLAKLTHDRVDGAVADRGSVDTRTGAMLGTCSYMAPEQVRGDAVDARTDLFAFGAVLYEMLSARRAFDGATSFQVWHRILQTEPPALETHDAVTTALACLVERCLAKDPADRFASAAAAMVALEAAARGVAPESRRLLAPPPVQYARVGAVHLAWQELGHGPAVVVVPGFISNIEGLWEDDDCRRFLTRMAERNRVVMFDKRGTGLSDRVAADPRFGLEDRVDDVIGMVERAGDERPVLLGVSEGGAIVIQYAATYPERIAGAVVYASTARFGGNEILSVLAESVRTTWGTGGSLRLFGASVADDPEKLRWWARWERGAASPGTAAAHLAATEHLDVRSALRLVRVPCLVMHRPGDPAVDVEAGRIIAERIPGARFVELEGCDHMPMLGDWERFLDELHAHASACQGSKLGPIAHPAVVATTDASRHSDVAVAAFADIPSAVEHALAVAAAGGRAAVHTGAPDRAAPIARAALGIAKDGDVIASGLVRGATVERYRFEEQGVRLLVDGAPATRLFSIAGRVDAG